MRLQAMAVMAALVASGGVWAEEAGNRLESVVPVCVDMDNEKPEVILQAEILGSRLFRTAGVEIHWSNGLHPCKNGPGVVIVSLGAASRSDSPGALAAGQPYEGIHIVVFYDRVKAVPRAAQPTLLAHVLVHEITHILQGVSCHAPAGIMKAHWEDADFSAMLRKPLPFTSQDIELIHMGLEKRASRAAAAALAASR